MKTDNLKLSIIAVIIFLSIAGGFFVINGGRRIVGNVIAEDTAIGMIETKGFVTAVEATDAMLKAASVKLIGKSNTGDGLYSVYIMGDVAAVKAATDAGAVVGGRIGEVVAVQVIPTPNVDIWKVLTNIINKKGKLKLGAGKAIGMIETKGQVAMTVATDAMLNAADVEAISYDFNDALTTITIQGDVVSVRAAIESGVQAASQVGELVASHIIPRPNSDISGIFSGI